MPRIPFDNTEIAFAHKTNQDLKKARLLFQTFRFPTVVKYGPGLAAALIDYFPPLKRLIKNTLFAQFCGGEDIADCHNTSKILSHSRIGTILDYSVEGEDTEEVFNKTAEEIIKTIREAKDNPDIPFSVFKCTGIGHIDLLGKVNAGTQLDEKETALHENFEKRFNRICLEAYQNRVRLFVDAEDSWIQDVIDKLTYGAMERYNQEKVYIFNTIQCYRTGRVEHIKKQISSSTYFIGLKLVRGAYMEKERERAKELNYTSPIHDNKEATDKEYNAALKLCIENIERISFCAGTHNEESSQYLADLMEEYRVEKTHPHIYFAQLLGMSDHISFNLSSLGYQVAKYVPYGPVKAVLPYLGRRAQENSSVKGQVGRELALIHKELLRRKRISK